MWRTPLQQLQPRPHPAQGAESCRRPGRGESGRTRPVPLSRAAEYGRHVFSVLGHRQPSAPVLAVERCGPSCDYITRGDHEPSSDHTGLTIAARGLPRFSWPISRASWSRCGSRRRAWRPATWPQPQESVERTPRACPARGHFPSRNRVIDLKIPFAGSLLLHPRAIARTHRKDDGVVILSAERLALTPGLRSCRLRAPFPTDTGAWWRTSRTTRSLCSA
jgi:hypothetical protein